MTSPGVAWTGKVVAAPSLSPSLSPSEGAARRTPDGDGATLTSCLKRRMSFASPAPGSATADDAAAGGIGTGGRGGNGGRRGSNEPTRRVSWDPNNNSTAVAPQRSPSPPSAAD